MHGNIQRVNGSGLSVTYCEEAYEILNEDDFNMLDESIRGAAPEGLFKQITLTLNPWNERHWIKKRFFDVEKDPDILAKTTNYLCNEFLDEADKRVFERMKRDNPRRYQVAGLGNWGIVDGLVFENWEERKFDIKKLLRERKHMKTFFGLDFGYTNDPTAFFAGAVDEEAKEIYVFDEMYEYALTNRMIYEEISKLGYEKERIRADSAEPKSIDDLYELGLKGIMKARKGKDSVNNGIQTIQDYKIIIHPSCVNFLTEITNYTWDEDKFGKKINKPIDDFNHLMDAMRYALEDIKGELFSFD
ncbi:PBSX family phage terminase large subunit [Peptococcaceae bacterium 1198_IL3148]